MKLTEPDIKIKVTRENLKTLNFYLSEILVNSNIYLEEITKDKEFKKIMLYNLQSAYEKITKIQFKNYFSQTNYKALLKFTNGERLTLVKLVIYYPLPLDINFIEYELKNKLITT
jgi:hypothetical protein